MSVALLLLAGAAPARAAEEHIQPYTATVFRADAQYIGQEAGVDLAEGGYDGDSATQHLDLELFPSQAAGLEAKGIELTAQTLPKLAPKAARATGGDSPKPLLRRLPQLLGARRD